MLGLYGLDLLGVNFGDDVHAISETFLLFLIILAFVTFLPALVWIASDLDAAWAIVAAVLIFLPHLGIDDGRVVRLYLSRVKRVDGFDVGLAASVDQTFHVLSLWLVAMLVGAA